jgi:hypothetical protein
MSAPMSRADVERVHRDAAVGGAVIAVVVAGLALVASAVLFALGILAIVLGVVFCLTVIGVIVGIPLIALGVLALVGAAVSWVGGVPFALILGAGAGFLWYRHRVRGLPY